MGAWIGELGALIELKCPASAGRSQAPDYSIETTLGGVDKAQVGRNVARTWDLDVGPAYPEATMALTRFHYGMYGLGPWWFIDPWAAVSNVMTPSASMPGPTYKSWSGSATASGAWRVPGMGNVRHSLLPDGGTMTLGAGTPVHPGLPVTGAVHAAGVGPGRVTTQVLDIDGSMLTEQAMDVTFGTVPGRYAATIAVIPQGGVSARVLVQGAQQVGLPSISWTDTATGWAPGQGTARALVEAVDVSPVIAVAGGPVLGTHRATIIEMRG